LKLFSKKMTSSDVCFRNINLLALGVEKRNQIRSVLARYSLQDVRTSWPWGVRKEKEEKWLHAVLSGGPRGQWGPVELRFIDKSSHFTYPVFK